MQRFKCRFPVRLEILQVCDAQGIARKIPGVSPCMAMRTTANKFRNHAYLKRTPTWSATTEQHRSSLVSESQHHLVKEDFWLISSYNNAAECLCNVATACIPPCLELSNIEGMFQNFLFHKSTPEAFAVQWYSRVLAI
jgi:hypothetical protein